ncbi:hypothetical protein [Rhodanobacter lindaniclasticus]
MTIHLKDGRNLFLNFREKAPLKATPKMFQDADGNVVEGQQHRQLSRRGHPGAGDGFRHRAEGLRHDVAEAGHRAGDQAGARGLHPQAGRCRQP